MATVRDKYHPSDRYGVKGSVPYRIIRGRVRGQSFFRFTEDVIARLRQLGRTRTSETYASAVNSFLRFLDNRAIARDDPDYSSGELFIDDLDSEMMQAYEAYLKETGVCPNSSSFYMRNLRALYNRAVEENLTVQRFPFRHVYTGVERTTKRAIPLEAMRRIKEMDLSGRSVLCFARDMFLFSFYSRGMSFVDMAYLRKGNLKGGIISYRRHKTGRKLVIRLEKCMQGIIERYETRDSDYLLPIIKPGRGVDERKQYLRMEHNVNRALRIIGSRLGLSVPLTMYVARHSWASIAHSKNIPISVICEGMGHDSELTTRIYLASFDNVAVDDANSLIINSL